MKTVGDLKDKLKKLTCLEEGGFIADDELCCLINLAQQELAKTISCLNKDFHKSCSEEVVAADTKIVDLPADIQGGKIRSVSWLDGKTCCRLRRTDVECFCDKSSTPCEYDLFNKGAAGSQIYLNPAPSKEGTIRIVYDRQPVEITATTTETEEIEFPEWCMFYLAFVRMFIYEKEKNPMLNLAINQLNEQKKLIEECLTGATDGCEIEADSKWECFVNESPY